MNRTTPPNWVAVTLCWGLHLHHEQDHTSKLGGSHTVLGATPTPGTRRVIPPTWVGSTPTQGTGSIPVWWARATPPMWARATPTQWKRVTPTLLTGFYSCYSNQNSEDISPRVTNSPMGAGHTSNIDGGYTYTMNPASNLSTFCPGLVLFLSFCDSSITSSILRARSSQHRALSGTVKL
jgi:hypothetical protein